MTHIRDILQNDFHSAKSQSFETVLTVSNSANEENEYLTPIRLAGQHMITGLISTNIESILDIINSNKNLINHFFIDIEKKIPPKFMANQFESGNYYDLVKARMPNLEINPIAPNVLTVNAVVSKILKWKTKHRSLRVGIVGFGNLGFKIAQLSVEIGCDTFILPRKISYKEVVQAEAINFSKPKGTIASVTLVDSLEKLFIQSDVFVLTSPRANIINEQNFSFFKEKFEIIDVGKGNVSTELVNSLPNLSWLDVGDELVQFILAKISEKKNIQKKNYQISNLPSNVKMAGKIVGPNNYISTFDGNSYYAFAKINEKLEYNRLSFNQLRKYPK